jgi:protein-arginine kinase activator protein McsA
MEERHMSDEKREHEYVCAECGTERDDMKPCEKQDCKSVRVVLISVVEGLFGKDWREKSFVTKPPASGAW